MLGQKKDVYSISWPSIETEEFSLCDRTFELNSLFGLCLIEKIDSSIKGLEASLSISAIF